MPWYLQVLQLCCQTRPHAPSVWGFQGNWRPPACSAELCSLVKAGQTPLLSCQWVTMDSPPQDATVSPALLIRFQALPLNYTVSVCRNIWQPNCIVLFWKRFRGGDLHRYSNTEIILDSRLTRICSILLGNYCMLSFLIFQNPIVLKQ